MYAAVRKYGVPEVLVSDNGSIFTSHDTRRLCEQLGIAKQEIKKGCPYQSPQIESWERSEVECFVILRGDGYRQGARMGIGTSPE
jgi:transposase InsO family protein